MGEVISFVSGKGGMGKTTLCAAVAATLAKAGKEVLCIDCDDGMGDLAWYLNVAHAQNLTYPEVCSGAYPLEKATRHPYFSSLCFLAAPYVNVFPRWTPDRYDLERLMDQARQQFDYVLLDGELPEIFPDRWVLVTRADPAAVRGALRKASVLQSLGAENVRLVVNCLDKQTLSQHRTNVDDIMDTIGLPLLGLVPPDRRLNEYAWCVPGDYRFNTAGAAVQRITSRLQGHSVAIPSRAIK